MAGRPFILILAVLMSKVVPFTTIVTVPSFRRCPFHRCLFRRRAVPVPCAARTRAGHGDAPGHERMDRAEVVEGAGSRELETD